MLDSLIHYSSETRLYEFNLRDSDDLSPWLDDSGLLVVAFSSRNGLHQLSSIEVLVIARRADLPIELFVGRIGSLQISLVNADRTAMTGLISQITSLGSDSGLARYQIRLSSWLSLLTQTMQSRVWQDRTLDQIIDSVFEDYRPHAYWQWTDDARQVLSQLPERSYCVQYRETPLAFISRLLAEEGFSFWVNFDAPEAPGGHSVILFADSTYSSACPDNLDQQHANLRYTGSGSQLQTDSIIKLSSSCRLQPNRVTLSSFDYKAKALNNTSLNSDVCFGGAHYAQLTPIEHYDYPGQYAFTDSQQALRHARLRIQAYEARSQYWQGLSTVRSLRAGQRVRIDDNPRNIEVEALAYVICHVMQVGINNLPNTVADHYTKTLSNSIDWLVTCLANYGSDDADPLAGNLEDQGKLLKTVQDLGYANAFSAIPAERPWRPWQCLRLNAKPTVLGSQTARVVGFDHESEINDSSRYSPIQQIGNNEICCDHLGRVRIRFHWQDPLDQKGSLASCWVRVAQRSAVAGMGMQFLPRIGQEVHVQFLEGDIDRPIIIGAHYNGQGQGGQPATPDGLFAPHEISAFKHANDHHASAQTNLTGGHAPVWHGASPDKAGHNNPAAQWGIRSQEYGSTGYNQLVFDDSNQQGRIQLKTTQTGAQLNLGYLIHTADNYRGSYRGQGLELRTDAWGALRAGAGWLVTSYGVTHNANHRQAAADCPASWGLLNYADVLSQALSRLAEIHLSLPLTAQLGITKANASQLDDKTAPLKALINVTKGLVNGSNIDLAYADACHKSTQASPNKLPQYTDPIISLISQDDLSVTARQSLQFISTETINIINAGDSQVSTGGQWRIHSGQAIGLTAGGLSHNQTAGLQIIAAQGDTHLQAHTDRIDIKARDQLDIKSAQAHIDLAAAKHITLRTAGGACIEIKGGNINVKCPGKITIHAGQKKFLEPISKNYRLPVMPKTESPKEKINFRLLLADMPGKHGHILPDRPWQIVRLKGAGDCATNPKQWRQILFQGMSDGSGECLLDQAQKLTLWQQVHQNPQAFWLVSGANAIPLTLTLLAASDPDRDSHKTLDAHNYVVSKEHVDDGQKDMLRQWAEQDYGTSLTATPKNEIKT